MINQIITIAGQDYILTPIVKQESKTLATPVTPEIKAEPKKSMSEIQKANQIKYYKEIAGVEMVGLYKSENKTISYLTNKCIAKHVSKDTFKVDLKGKVKTYTLAHFTGTLKESGKMRFFIKGQETDSKSLMSWFNGQGFTEFSQYKDAYMWVSANYNKLTTVL